MENPSSHSRNRDFIISIALLLVWVRMALGSWLSPPRAGAFRDPPLPASNCMPQLPPYAGGLSPKGAIGVDSGEQALCAPDRSYASIGTTPYSALVLDMQRGNEIVDGLRFVRFRTWPLDVANDNINDSAEIDAVERVHIPPTPTPTGVPTPTRTSTPTPTPTSTPVPTRTPAPTLTPTSMATPTVTPTATPWVLVVTQVGPAGLRVRYSPAGVIVGYLWEGTSLIVTDGPVEMEGQEWYRVLSGADRIEGWVAGDYLSEME